MQETASAWKISQLTDGELISRRAEIERKLGWLTPDNPRAQVLHGELKAITAEVQDRVHIRKAGYL